MEGAWCRPRAQTVLLCVLVTAALPGERFLVEEQSLPLAPLPEKSQEFPAEARMLLVEVIACQVWGLQTHVVLRTPWPGRSRFGHPQGGFLLDLMIVFCTCAICGGSS